MSVQKKEVKDCHTGWGCNHPDLRKWPVFVELRGLVSNGLSGNRLSLTPILDRVHPPLESQVDSSIG